MPNIIKFMITATFWTVAFSTYGSVSLELFRTLTSETILEKKATVQFP